MSEPGSASPDSTPSSQGGFQREFQFIDGQDKSARKKSRAHVTKEHYRERRWNREHAQKAQSSSALSSLSVQHLPFDFEVRVSRLEPGDQGDRRKGVDCKTQHLQGHLDQQLTLPKAESRSPEVREATESQSLYTPLGAGRLDPFQTYPIEATREVHQLVDHYHFVIPSLLHRHWGRRITHPMPIVDLFQLYRQDSASFLGMLHHAAQHLSKIRGIDVDTPQSIGFKQRTIEEVGRRIRSSDGPCDDGTIVAVGLLANAERIWGDRTVARMHWGAAKALIRDRGGFPAFRRNHLLHTKLIWSFIALSGSSAVGNPAYVDSFEESIADSGQSSNIQPRSAFQRSCDDFVNFFTSRRKSALLALPTSHADRAHHDKYPLRFTCFRPGSRMYRALDQVETGYSSSDKRRAVDNCRIACLIYLNIVIAEYGDFSARTENFLGIFLGFVEDDDFDCTLSAEHLLWALIRGIEEHPADERTWMVSRMVSVVKRASPRMLWDIEMALRLFLIMPDDGRELIRLISSWDTKAFRDEIMAFSESDASPMDVLDISTCDPRLRGLQALIADSDFLPETRDVQWFPSSTAATESGVLPHPKFLERTLSQQLPTENLSSN